MLDKFKMKRLTLLFCLIALFVASSCKKKEEFMSIYGTVTDSETNKLIEGATVTIYPSAKWLTTKSDGYFEFNDIDIRLDRELGVNGYVTAIYTDYISATVEFKLTPDERKEVNIKMKKY